MNELFIDWLWLYLQILLLLYVIVKEFLLPGNRNLFAILIPGAMLILVQGQAWWIFKQFDNMHLQSVEVVNNRFSLAMARKANFYYGICTICYVASYYIFRNVRWIHRTKDLTTDWIYRTNIFSYLFVGIWTLIMTVMLIGKVGGIDSALTKPGQMIEGQTVFILALGIAKWPLVMKLNGKQKIQIADVLFFAVAVLITLFNSRFLTAFALLQLFIVINYRKKEISRRAIMLMIIPATAVFLIFGIYRDFAYRFETVGIKEAAVQFADPAVDFSVLDWFYRNNIEGFSGMAGILNAEHENVNFHYDFGRSEFAILLNFIPNSVRNNPDFVFADVSNSLKEAFPYNGSVVPSGFELSYGHMGLPGLIIYSVVLGILTGFFHSELRKNLAGSIIFLLISVQLLNGVRASLFGALVFFGLADIITLWIYKLFLIRQENTTIINHESFE